MSGLNFEWMSLAGSFTACRGGVPPAPFIDQTFGSFALQGGADHIDLTVLPWRGPSVRKPTQQSKTPLRNSLHDDCSSSAADGYRHAGVVPLPVNIESDGNPLAMPQCGQAPIYVPCTYFATDNMGEIEELAKRICTMYAVKAADWLEEVSRASKLRQDKSSFLGEAIDALNAETQAVTDRLARVQDGPNANKWAKAFLRAWTDAVEAYVSSGFINDSDTGEVRFNNATEFDHETWTHWLIHLTVYQSPKEPVKIVETYPFNYGGVSIHLGLDCWGNTWHAKARILDNCNALGG